MSSIPVLMYHHVSPIGGDMVTVTPDVFEGQLRHIKEAGYAALSLDEAVDFATGKFEMKGKGIAITFDDGYLDNYLYAYPALKSHGIKAAVFIVTDWVERASAQEEAEKAEIESFLKKPPTHGESKALIDRGEHGKAIMNWRMIGEMKDSGLVNFYSHTVTHRSSDQIHGEELKREIAASKAAIEGRLGGPCDYLCWPKGRYTGEGIEAAKAALYRALFTTKPGVVRKGDDPFELKRIVVKDSVDWFKRRLKIYTSPVLSQLYLSIKD